MGDLLDLYYAAIAQRAHKFPIPTSPIDMTTASQMTIEGYGILPEPDRSMTPDLHEFWRELTAGPLNLITPELPTAEKVSPYIIFSSLPQATASVPPVTSFAHRERSRNWSGAYITPKRPNRFNLIVGSWTVPDVRLPAKLPKGADVDTVFRSSTWIGLDGHRSRYPRASMPQIGTRQWVSGSGAPVREAWVQWWQHDEPQKQPIPIHNFDLKPNDVILAGMLVTSPNDVHFFMKNQRSGDYFALKMTPPGAIRPLGSTAEWIMERSTHPITGIDYLPDYGQTTFRYCIAQSTPGGALSIPITQTLSKNARCIDMCEPFDGPYRSAIVSRAKKIDATTMTVRYSGPA